LTDIREGHPPRPIKDVLFYVFGAAVFCAIVFYIVSLTVLPEDTSSLKPPTITSRLR
jgi:hypothetical protein